MTLGPDVVRLRTPVYKPHGTACQGDAPWISPLPAAA